MKWPLEDDWVPGASFRRRRKARNRDTGESCGHVKVVSFCPFPWHTGLGMGGLRATVRREQWTKMWNKFPASPKVCAQWGAGKTFE